MTERRNKVIRIALVSLGTGALYALFVRLTGLGIPCLFNLVTKLKCPGCGVSRMFLSLFRLDFISAFHHNAAIFCLLPLMAFVAARYAYVYIKYDRIKDRLADTAVIFMTVSLLVFGVIRNIIPGL
ncbi:MAG: DUF2752 domain-containing protein [Clostridia bacterium]|nr:DUF2752 domain-containing protein [Clostridia bacterium]